MALFYAPLIYVLLYYFSDLPSPTLMLSTPIKGINGEILWNYLVCQEQLLRTLQVHHKQRQ